jgi:uncharacterized protein YneR
MQLIITDTASRWIRQQFHLPAGAGIKFFGKTIQPGHVTHGPDQGYTREDQLTSASLTVVKDKINYHINFADSWFFSGLITTIDLDTHSQKINFHFTKEKQQPVRPSAKAPQPDASTGASEGGNFEEFWE